MRNFTKTLIRDIVTLSAQVVSFRMTMTQEQQKGIVFAVMPFDPQKRRNFSATGPSQIQGQEGEEEGAPKARIGF